ncbi:butyrophilin subfamily 3 member A3-like [Pelodiscus sinensis]|uniref:butyrophilin subfamily 3 member A3-like n=1 Tax=Pelodiscus sinensis TaxID=13735 RepID=UPI003F6A8FB7
MAPQWLSADLLGILILLTHSVSEKFSLSGSPHPIIGIVGQDMVLPCQLSPKTWPADMELLWTKIEQTHNEAGYVNVHRYKDQPNLDTSGENYQNRTELFQKELRNGNVSLKLKTLHVADAGTYICFVKSPAWSHEVNTELQIAAVAPVFIDVLGPQGQGIGLACKSGGWFPKPELRWIGNKGQILALESKVGMTQDSDHLYSVLGQVTVPGGEASAAPIACVVRNNLLKTEQQSAIHLSHDIFPHTSPWLAAFWVSFVLLLLTNGVWAFRGYKEKQNVSQKKNSKEETLLSLEALKKELESELHDQSKRIERLTAELDFRKARSYMESITLDPNCTHPELKVSTDKRSVWNEPGFPESTTPSEVLIAVGEGFVRRKLYWEVEVGEEPDWELGVLSETVRGEVREAALEHPPVEGCWSLRRSEGQYYPTEAHTKIQEWDLWPTVIGVYLDRDAETISFYNVNALADILVIPFDNSEKVYPFLRPRPAVGRDKGKSLRICPDTDWDFPTKLSAQTVCQDRDLCS